MRQVGIAGGIHINGSLDREPSLVIGAGDALDLSVFHLGIDQHSVEQTIRPHSAQEPVQGTLQIFGFEIDVAVSCRRDNLPVGRAQLPHFFQHQVAYTGHHTDRVFSAGVKSAEGSHTGMSRFTAQIGIALDEQGFGSSLGRAHRRGNTRGASAYYDNVILIFSGYGFGHWFLLTSVLSR